MNTRDDAPTFRLASFKFKGPAAIVAIVVIAIGAFFYNDSRRSTLHAQGRPQVEEYLRTGLTAGHMHEREAKDFTLEGLEAATDLEIIDFTTRLVPRDQTTVRVTVSLPEGEKALYFRFKRVLGDWRLLREEHRLLPW